MSAPQIDLDKLEQAAKAAQEHGAALGSDWFTEQEAACNLDQADAAFVAAASPLAVLELISRLRTAEDNYQAATLRANANAEMLRAVQSQPPAVMDVNAVASVLACEIEAGIYEQHVAPALQAAWKVASERQQQAEPLSAALADIAAERRRQIEAEGWTAEHDDAHRFGNMAFAAACYAIAGGNIAPSVQSETVAAIWPWTGWSWAWWKPKDKRRNLVRAGALIAAEIERLDRFAATAPESGSQQ